MRIMLFSLPFLTLYLFCPHFVLPATVKKPSETDPKILFEIIKKDGDFDSAQAINFDFTSARQFYTEAEIPKLYVKVAEAIYRCVSRFYRENEPVFILTAILHMEYMGENLVGLPDYEECLLSLGRTRKALLELAKNDLVFARPLQSYNSYTLSVTLRDLALGDPVLAEYFPTDPYIIDVVFSDFPFNSPDYYGGFEVKDLMFTYFLGQYIFKKTTTSSSHNIIVDWVSHFARHFSNFQILELNKLLSSVLSLGYCRSPGTFGPVSA